MRRKDKTLAKKSRKQCEYLNETYRTSIENLSLVAIKIAFSEAKHQFYFFLNLHKSIIANIP